MGKDNFIYAAGLFDGEGSITACFNKSKNRTQLKFSMSSTSIALVEFMLHNFGGSLHTHIDARGYKSQHQWHAGAKDGCVMLLSIRPYLREENKIARADIIIKYYIPWIEQRTLFANSEKQKALQKMLEIK